MKISFDKMTVLWRLVAWMVLVFVGASFLAGCSSDDTTSPTTARIVINNDSTNKVIYGISTQYFYNETLHADENFYVVKSGFTTAPGDKCSVSTEPGYYLVKVFYCDNDADIPTDKAVQEKNSCKTPLDANKKLYAHELKGGDSLILSFDGEFLTWQ